MKILMNLLSLAILLITASSTAQKNHPIYDYGEMELTSTASIPEYEAAEQKIKITGKVYKSDGKTPAADVILYFYQTDEDGEYEIEGENRDDKHIYHRTWIKTDQDGNYNLYTFIPGTNYGSNQMKHIHTFVKQPNMPEYQIDGFLFDDDPYLSNHCRKKLKKAGANNILKPTQEGEILVAERDIVLDLGPLASK